MRRSRRWARMRRGSISWRRWGERDRSVTRGFDETGNCVLDAEFDATDGPVVEGDGQARGCDFDAETRRETQRSGAVKERTSAETAEDGGLRFGADALSGEEQRESENLRARRKRRNAGWRRREG